MSDRLEELRHELADVEAGMQAVEEGATPDPRLDVRRREVEAEILQLERAAREEAGAQPEAEEVTAEAVAESRPAPADLVVPPLPPGDERTEATIVVLDRHDEDRILNALEERMDKVLLYDFEQGGSRLVDLSYNGVMECVRQINQTQHAKLRILPGSLVIGREDIEDKGEHVVVDVAAEDMLTGLVIYGTASEPRYPKKKGGGTYYDKFARAKAISKAQRNALKQHIPERLKQAVIALYKGDAQRVLEVRHGAGAVAAAQLPPPVVSDRAKELEARCRVVYLEIRGLPRGLEKLKPGQFNFELARARSSEDALLSQLEAWESLRDALKAAAEGESGA